MTEPELSRKRLPRLRAFIILACLSVIGLQVLLIVWLFRNLPEYLFVRFETEVADEKLAFWFRCIAVVSPALLTAWLLAARWAWRRLNRKYGAVRETARPAGWAGRLLLTAGRVIYWTLIAGLAIRAAFAPVFMDWENQRVRERICSEFSKDFGRPRLGYREIRRPRILPGRDVLAGDLRITLPPDMVRNKKRPEANVYDGDGFYVVIGKGVFTELAFPPPRDEDDYLLRCYFRIDSTEKHLENLYSFDVNSIDAIRSRFGICAAAQMWVQQGMFLGFDHHVWSFTSAGGFRIFVHQFRLKEGAGRRYMITVIDRERDRERVHTVGVLERKPKVPPAKSHGNPATGPLTTETVLSIAASIRRK